MSRRRDIPKREIIPDPKYRDVLVAKFVNRLMLDGKKSVAQNMFYKALDLVAERSNEEPFGVFKKAVENALSQLEGRFSKEIRQIRENIVKALSLLELNIDFSEEDIEVITDDEIYNILSQTEQAIARFLDSYQKGKLLQNGLKVLITGKPNVGKSLYSIEKFRNLKISLINLFFSSWLITLNLKVFTQGSLTYLTSTSYLPLFRFGSVNSKPSSVVGILPTGKPFTSTKTSPLRGFQVFLPAS